MLKGKVAIVSGAAQGLGEAFARKLAQEGATVLAFDVQDKIADVAKKIDADTGAKVVGMKADVSKSAVLFGSDPPMTGTSPSWVERTVACFVASAASLIAISKRMLVAFLFTVNCVVSADRSYVCVPVKLLFVATVSEVVVPPSFTKVTFTFALSFFKRARSAGAPSFG